MGGFLGFLGLLLFLGGIVGLIVWRQRRLQEALRDATHVLRFTTCERDEKEDGWKADESHRPPA